MRLSGLKEAAWTMPRLVVLVSLLVASLAAGCSGDSYNPDSTAPREGQPSPGFNEIGPDPPKEPSPPTNAIPNETLEEPDE